MQKVELIDSLYIFNCPNCFEKIIVDKKELNCRIFRHAIYKHNYKQVDPHLNKQECENHIKNDLVFGCCKPFEIVIDDKNKIYATICEYK